MLEQRIVVDQISWCRIRHDIKSLLDATKLFGTWCELNKKYTIDLSWFKLMESRYSHGEFINGELSVQFFNSIPRVAHIRIYGKPNVLELVESWEMKGYVVPDSIVVGRKGGLYFDIYEPLLSRLKKVLHTPFKIKTVPLRCYKIKEDNIVTIKTIITRLATHLKPSYSFRCTINEQTYWVHHQTSLPDVKCVISNLCINARFKFLGITVNRGKQTLI